MEETIDPMDRLSELPPFIIHQIMSHLSAKEVARTSILSKTWNLLHSSYPILDFHDSYIYFVGKDLATKFPVTFTRDQISIFPQRIHKFIEFVDASLVRFCQLNFAMQKFRLLIRLLDVEAPSSLLLDKWIGLAIENKVKELDFTFHCRRDIEPLFDCRRNLEHLLYTLPQSIFTAKSVTTLNIFGCKLVQLCESIRLHSLKSLTLREVCINEECLQKLTTQCPLLEDLVLSNCLGFRRIYVVNACKLKIINIFELPKDLQSIKIVVPSLQQFILKCNYLRVVPTVIDMAECPNLKVLQVSGVAFTDQGFHRLISKFPLLESLYVCHCFLLEQITISSNLLKNLGINGCPRLKAIDVDTPNLVSFSFYNHPPISSINAPCLWKVGIKSAVWAGIEVDPDTHWYLNVKEFLGASNQIEELTFTVSGNMNSFNFDEFRKSTHSLPCEVGTLNLRTYEQSSNYAAFLDGVFGICYARTLSASMSIKNHFFEWLYKQLMSRDTRCCNSHDIKCWRHYLKDVKIGSFVPYKDKKPIHIDNPLEALPDLPIGILWFHLDWCLPMPIEKA
ncbi:hypothetical protein Ddye_014678 [Dipteronia dyeriana]|uniref:F-box domain-containing protein n=1 Tax=Dipteronia dyeriana TaxID=168575 RepID=A0AAE0CKS9_9ROSI|nr:hypothetical protein Ddye_014678 [Dipteronia dyeriana]